MKQFTFLFIIGLCIANILASCVVQTPLGLIKGSQVKSRSGKTIYAYRGIPYAESTAGENRFRNPVPKKKWDHILEADHERCECPQAHDGAIHGCEDCLHLNIYTTQRNPKVLLPVLVYIHSGNYKKGNSSINTVGPGYLLDHDVVLVGINYRLNILGWLSTGDSAAPGNYGLKDQALALKWIKENIKIFGGDPEEITIFGESAGSQCVNYHLASSSKHLFKQAILQSGNFLYPNAFAVGPSYHEKAKKVAKLLKCPTKDNHKMIECLRKVHVTEIVKVALQVFDDVEKAIQTWAPTLEQKGPGAFITASPETLIQEKQWKPTALIIGNVKDDGTAFTEHFWIYPKLYDLSRKDPVGVIKRFLEYYSPLDGMNITDIAVKAMNHYIGTKVPESKEVFVKGFTNLVSSFYLFLTEQLLKNFPGMGLDKVFAYSYDYIGTLTVSMNFPGNLKRALVAHADDVFSIFPLTGTYISPQYSSLKRSEKDYEIVDILTDLWTSFAKNSVPSSGKLKNPHLWQPQRNTTQYLKIGNGVSTEVTLEEKYSSRVDFWFKNVPQYCLE